MTTYKTVGDILKSVGALTEQDAIFPTGTDLSVRIQYVNDALGEWADAYTWEDLRITYNINTLASLTSIGLPTNFRQPLSTLYVATETSLDEYALINARDRFSKEATDKYCYLYGTLREKSLQIPNVIPANASCVIDYMSFPSSVASFNDYVPISSSQYLVKRVSAMVFQARGDNRYPQLQADAERFLSNTIEEQNVPFGRVNRIPINYQSFSIGVDG